MLGQPMDSEVITIGSVAKGLTESKYHPASGDMPSKALVTAEGGDMRFTLDDITTPSASVGHLLQAGDILTLENIYYMKQFKAVRVGSVDGKLVVTYEG